MTPDPFYTTMRAFLLADATWEEVEKADAESRQAEDQHYAFLRRIEIGLKNPDTCQQILNLLSSVPIPSPSE